MGFCVRNSQKANMANITTAADKGIQYVGRCPTIYPCLNNTVHQGKLNRNERSIREYLFSVASLL